MRTAATTAAIDAVAICLCSLLAWSARSAPPAAHDGIALMTHLATPVESARRVVSGVQTSLSQTRSHGAMGPLDLRAPEVNDTASTTRSQTFASSRRPLAERDYQSRLSKLAGDDLAMHSEGGVREIAQRVRRQGVPIARLWETHSALLSLGLNQRGKPGLWLIQKTR